MAPSGAICTSASRTAQCRTATSPANRGGFTPAPTNEYADLIARAHRWQQLLLQGAYATIEELAEAEPINPSYVRRLMRLACLAPEITEAILEGQHPSHLTAKELLAPFPLDWAGQRAHFKPG
jgi:hypothetical protein